MKFLSTLLFILGTSAFANDGTWKSYPEGPDTSLSGRAEKQEENAVSGSEISPGFDKEDYLREEETSHEYEENRQEEEVEETYNYQTDPVLESWDGSVAP